MELVTGGCFQGKTEYALAKYPNAKIRDNGNWNSLLKKKKKSKSSASTGRPQILRYLDLYVRDELRAGKSAEEIRDAVRHLIKRIEPAGRAVILTDEIGCGIVPMDPFERAWRETAGRIAADFAAEADAVTRVQCGIPTVLKRGTGGLRAARYRITDCQEQNRQERDFRPQDLQKRDFQPQPPRNQDSPSGLSFLLIRHGQTRGNEKRRYIGRTDELLSEGGQAQISSLRDRLSAAGLLSGAFRVYASPMRRCRESAEILFPGREILYAEDLREIDFGDFEGKSAQDLSGNPAYQQWIDSGGTLPFPGGESRDAFEKRSHRAFLGCAAACLYDPEQILAAGAGATGNRSAAYGGRSAYGPDPYANVSEHGDARHTAASDRITAAFVVHGGTIMSVLSFLTGRDYFDFQIPNGEGFLLRLTCKDGRMQVREAVRLDRLFSDTADCREKEQ